MNYYTTLLTQIEQIQSSGRQVKLTKLPSVVNINNIPSIVHTIYYDFHVRKCY